MELEVGKRYRVTFDKCRTCSSTSYVEAEDDKTYYFLDDGEKFSWSLHKESEGVTFEETTEILTGENK